MKTLTEIIILITVIFFLEVESEREHTVFPHHAQIAVCTKYEHPLTKHYIPSSPQVEKRDGEMPFFMA